MARSQDNIWLHRFALLTAVATFCLIWVGGLTTSHGAGMAVPDWPTTYGYNMFFFPYSRWVGGIFYEHSHRLVASMVGLLTVVLAVWLWVKEERAWLRRLGLVAVALVVLQGTLGGLRVTQMKDVIGVFHATLAQTFFVLACALALFTSRWWVQRGVMLKLPVYGRGGIRYAFAFITVMVLTQLIIGAAMRHQHAGLAIPDFPRAYGQWWPDVDAASIARYNQARGEVNALNPVTAFQIYAQMAHRFMAVAILCAVAWLYGSVRRRFHDTVLSRWAGVWLWMIVAQAGLGMFTIWSNKAADVATAHVALGALSLVTGGLLSIVVLSATRALKRPAQARRTTRSEATQVLA